jgi:hypothetical protein
MRINAKQNYSDIYTNKCVNIAVTIFIRVADKSLAQPTSPYILFDGENISFGASLIIYINSTNIPPIMIINGISVVLISP